MVSLAGILGNNSVGYRHRLGKVNRAVLRSSRRLLDSVFVSHQSRFAALDGNKFLEVISGTPDVARLQRCFDRIARGLHLHQFGVRFDGEVKTHMGYLQPPAGNASVFRDFIRHRVDVDLAGKQRLGANPEVFSYCFSDADALGYYMVELCFYGGVRVYSAFLPARLGRPSDLTGLLIDRGIRTIINLDGRTYEFNADQDVPAVTESSHDNSDKPA